MIMPVHSFGLAFQMNESDAWISPATLADVGTVHGAVRRRRLIVGWFSADYLMFENRMRSSAQKVLEHSGCLTRRQSDWPVLQQ